MTDFTPIASTIGGAMIGASAVLLMATHGRIAGISGIAVRLFPPYLDKDSAGRLMFILGLIAAPMVYAALTGAFAPMTIAGGAGVLIVAGVLAGFGSVWGNGCTSGHGICGLSRLSIRSAVAVAVFMLAAVITVFIARHII